MTTTTLGRCALVLRTAQCWMVMWFVLLVSPLIAAPTQPAERLLFDLPAESAEKALVRFSVQAGVEVLFATQVTTGVTTKAVRGEFTVMEALSRMLTGSELIAARDEATRVVTVKRIAPKPKNMNTTTKIRRALVGVLLGLSTTTTVPAQTNPQSNDKETASKEAADKETLQLSPFVVSTKNDRGYQADETLVGSRTAKNLLDIPASIQIIGKEMIADLNAFEVTQVLKVGVSGVSPQHVADDGVYIRGFGTFLAMRDGVNMLTYKRNPMYDVERIEVVKGPGAMMLGNNGFLGGAINFISRKPTENPMGEVQVTLSDHNYVRLQANMSGPIYKSADLTALYRLTVGGHRGDHAKEMFYDDQKFIGGALLFYFGADSSLSVNASYLKDNDLRYWGDFLDITSTKYAKLNQYSTPSFAYGLRRDNMWKADIAFVNATFLTKLTENSNLRAYYFATSNKDRRFLSRGIAVHPDNYTLDRQEFPVTYDALNQTLQLDYLYRLQLKNLTNDLTVGADAFSGYDRFDYSTTHTLPPVLGPLDTRNPDYSADAAHTAAMLPGTHGLPNNGGQLIGRQLNTSYYVQDSLSFWKDRLLLVGGLRWLKQTGTSENLLSAGSLSNNPETTTRTYKYGAVFKVLPTVSLYYSGAQNIYPQFGYTLDGLKVKDQQGNLSEFGLKFNHAVNDKVSLFGSVVHFDMALTNVLGFDSGGNYIYTGENTSVGWEVDYGMRINSANGYSDLLVTYYDAETLDENGNFSYGAIPHSYSFIGKHTWTGGPLQGLMLGASMNAQGDKNQGALLVATPATYNLFARYDLNKKWSFQANWDNVTDERYVVAVVTVGLAEASEPSRIRLSASYKW